ncbi:MAG TPA: hypothetical protein VFO34_17800 [Candidatus Acidoferrales bacterium]|nr:hypothetical protein [Candidatus Acidoferrales bacterium]
MAPRIVTAQIVVDRIIARVEGEVILLSEVRELGEFQTLVEGQPQPQEKRFDELIDQWIIEHEAHAAAFSEPSDTDVKAAREKLVNELGGPQQFQSRQAAAGIGGDALDRQIRRALFFSRYVDYKFRPSAQVDRDAVEKYYKEQFVPQMKARNQAAPSLDSVSEQIHELLVQQEISARATQWLGESRSHLKIENLLSPVAAKPDSRMP